MKNKNLSLAIVFIGLLASFTAKAQAVNFDHYENQYPDDLNEAFESAIAAALNQNPSIIQFSGNVYEFEATIFIKDADNLVLQGIGENSTTLKLASTPSSKRFIVIENSSNVNIRGMKIEGFANIGADATRIISTKESKNLKVENCHIDRGKFGISGFINSIETSYPDGLVVLNTTFSNLERGVYLERNNTDNNIVPKVESMTIRGCIFSEAYRSGIGFDAGNDDQDSLIINNASEQSWDLDNTIIDSCYFENAAASIWGLNNPDRGFHAIGLANVRNIEITNNTFRVGNSIDKNATSIHIEDNSQDILIENNRFENGSKNEISMIGFNGDNHEGKTLSMCRRIDIENNEFNGNAETCIRGESAADINFRNNIFQNGYTSDNLISFYKTSLDLIKNNTFEEDDPNNYNIFIYNSNMLNDSTHLNIAAINNSSDGSRRFGIDADDATIANIYSKNQNTCYIPLKTGNGIDGNCVEHELFNTNINSNTTIYATQSIQSSSTLGYNITVIFDASSFIQLNSGFKVPLTTDFKTKLVGCN